MVTTIKTNYATFRLSSLLSVSVKFKQFFFLLPYMIAYIAGNKINVKKQLSNNK